MSQDPRRPKKFVSLHNHTTFSSYDGLGYPDEHFKFCKSNGLDAHAITEHGHFNSYAHAELFVQEWKKSGNDFKFIPGIEAYYHPDLDEWRKLKDETANKKLEEKSKKKTELLAKVNKDDEPIEIETSNALTIENEDETKSIKKFNPLNRRHHLVLLPKNSEGLRELFHLTSRSYKEGYYRFPRIDTKMLKETLTKGNVLASSACIGGFVSWSIFDVLQRELKFEQLLPELLDDKLMLDKCVNAVGNVYDVMTDIFGIEDYYLELQFNKLGAQDVTNRAILEFARRNGLLNKLSVTCDAHYYNPDVWKEREIYKKLGFMNYQSFSADALPKSKDDLKCELFPKNADQLWEEYEKAKIRAPSTYDGCDDIVCDTIERMHDLAHSVIGEVKPDKSIKLPKKIIPKDETAIYHLSRLCVAGLKKRGLDKKKEYVERLKYELSVIEKLDMPSYFITLAKIIELAKEVVLLGAARGSGGGSLVNYVLYITDLDPIKWNLPFERFMSPYRVGLPDIDTDVADRDKVLEVMRKEFGDDNVVPISNYNLLKVKSLVKDLSKFYEIPYEEVNNATKTVEQDVRKATTKHGDDKNLFVLEYDDAMKYSESFRTFIEKYPQIGASMNVLFKQNRSLGRHAGGVLVCDDLPKQMPLIQSDGEFQSPWVEGVSYKHLEKIGNFVKFDILGIEVLRLVERAIELILIKRGEKHDFPAIKKWFDMHMAVDAIDLNDQKVYEYVYHAGRWNAIFQCTSQGAQRLFKAAKPTSITDIAALTSIYRPGPLAAKVDKLYLEAKNEGKQYDWGDKRINELLKDTYGLLIFQEGVMMLAEKVAGFPKDKCDEVRRAIMKRSISGGDAARAKVDQMKDDFVAGSMKNGYDKKVAENLYEKIAYFSGYAFNASHATGYSVSSYWCAWLHTHYEEEWLTAYLEASSSNPDDKAEAISNIKSVGYRIVPIDVNYALPSWTALPGKKFMPSLLSIKGIGSSAIEELLQNRPYKSIEDFLWDENGEWRHSKFNRKALDALIKVGGFNSLDCVGEDKLFKSYRHMYEVLINNVDEIKKSPRKDPGYGRRRLYELAREVKDLPDWTMQEKATLQVDVLGAIDVNLLISQDLLQELNDRGVRSIDKHDGTTDIYWFIATEQELKTTKKKTKYLRIKATGEAGSSVWLNVWAWKENKLIDAYSLCFAEIEKNDMGMSTASWKLKVLS